MVYKEIIIDADFCIKLGSSKKYQYLERLIPVLAEKVFIHEVANNEIKISREQIDALIHNGNVTVLSRDTLNECEKSLYDATFEQLAKVMMDRRNPNKNKGEVSSLAMAKVKGIPYFATDEKNLQPIIDSILNTKIGNDISCVRIINIIEEIKGGMLSEFTRKDAKAIWIIAGKNKKDFDDEIWPCV